MDVDAQKNILPDMKNLNGALAAAGLGGTNKTFPPSSGVFTDSDFMDLIAEYLEIGVRHNRHPTELRDIPGFQPGTTVSDVGNGLKYTSLFDAIYAALEHSGRPGVEVVVSETRLLSSGTSAANVQNARTYNQNLINHVGQGTPKSSRPLETYMFAMFKENLKKGDETERHFGLFNPDKSPAYTLSF
ncbi:hypothetical protein ACQ4PT_025728 [Festuca glaucescens]